MEDDIRCVKDWIKRNLFYCQAQPQLQVKLSVKAELALISVNPATPHPRETLFGILWESS